MTLAKDTLLLAGLFAVSGTVHLVKPEVYEPLMPSFVPKHREVILGSGVAELACAAGLLHPRTRRAAGWASAALLLGVFPGNLKMADDARRSRQHPVPGDRLRPAAPAAADDPDRRATARSS